MNSTDKDLQNRIDSLIQAGTAENTRRAYASDIKRFWAWADQTLGIQTIYPIQVNVILQFIMDHLPLDDNEQILKISTIQRYLASISVYHQEHGHPTPTTDPQAKLLLRRAKRALANQRPNKKAPITIEILQRLLAACDPNTLRGLRDRTILSLGFSCGGRRRDELAHLQYNDLTKTSDGYLLTISRSKTDQEQRGLTVPVTGQAVTYLDAWLLASGIRKGYLFRGIKPNGELNKGIDGRTINRIVKHYIEKIGLDPDLYGGHSLRAGFLTSTAELNIPLHQAMELSGHKDMSIASSYVHSTGLQQNPALNLLEQRLKQSG